MGRLNAFKGLGGVEATFGDRLDKVEEASPVITERKLLTAEKAAATVNLGLPANYLILEAWKDLESRLKSVAIARDLGDKRGKFRDALVIAKAIGLSEGQILTLTGLRSIRNDVVHTSDGRQPTTTDALRFVELSSAIMNQIPQS